MRLIWQRNRPPSSRTGHRVQLHVSLPVFLEDLFSRSTTVRTKGRAGRRSRSQARRSFVPKQMTAVVVKLFAAESHTPAVCGDGQFYILFSTRLRCETRNRYTVEQQVVVSRRQTP